MQVLSQMSCNKLHSKFKILVLTTSKCLGIKCVCVCGGAFSNWNVFWHLIHYLCPSPFKLIAAAELWASVGTSLDQQLNFVQWLE